MLNRAVSWAAGKIPQSIYNVIELSVNSIRDRRDFETVVTHTLVGAAAGMTFGIIPLTSALSLGVYIQALYVGAESTPGCEVVYPPQLDAAPPWIYCTNRADESLAYQRTEEAYAAHPPLQNLTNIAIATVIGAGVGFFKGVRAVTQKRNEQAEQHANLEVNRRRP